MKTSLAKGFSMFLILSFIISTSSSTVLGQGLLKVERYEDDDPDHPAYSEPLISISGLGFAVPICSGGGTYITSEFRSHPLSNTITIQNNNSHNIGVKLEFRLIMNNTESNYSENHFLSWERTNSSGGNYISNLATLEYQENITGTFSPRAVHWPIETGNYSTLVIIRVIEFDGGALSDYYQTLSYDLGTIEVVEPSYCNEDESWLGVIMFLSLPVILAGLLLLGIRMEKKNNQLQTMLEGKPSARSRYISNSTRSEVFIRDQGMCVYCGATENLEFDHVIPFSKGGSNSVKNIQLLCESCNRKKSDNLG